MNLKEYMKAKKLQEAAKKVYNIKPAKKGDGKKNGSRKKQSKNHDHDSQGN